MLEQISSYLRRHEGMILGIAFLSVALFLGNKYLNYEAAATNKVAQQAQAIAAQQQVIVNNLTQQLQTAQQHSDALVAHLAANDAKQEAEIANLKATLAQKQQQVQVEPLPEVAAEWNSQIKIPDGVRNTPTGLTITEAAARATVEELIEVPTLQNEVDDLKQMVDDASTTIESQQTTIKAADDLAASLKVQITDDNAAHAKEITALKAAARKSKFKIFWIGYGLGFVSREAIYLGTGR